MEYFSALPEDDVLKLIRDMPSKFCDLDHIPTWLLKRCLPELLPVLHYIINESLSTGSFPNKLKENMMKTSSAMKKSTMSFWI